MAEINIYYHKQTNSWWTDNKNLDGLSFANYVKNNPVGVGRINLNSNDKKDIKELYEIQSMFIPQHVKYLVEVTEEIDKNGLKNATKSTQKKLRKLLDLK